ncbi:hypothetical protein OROMI_030562 [Orobanche minor]
MVHKGVKKEISGARGEASTSSTQTLSSMLPNADTQDAKSGGEKFQVRILGDSSAQITEDVLCQAGKGGDLTHDKTTIIAGAPKSTEKTAKDAMTPISKTLSLDLKDDLFECFNSSNAGITNSNLSGSASLTNGYEAPMYPAGIRNGNETWFEVERSKPYTPTADDIGHVLKFECSVVDAVPELPVGQTSTLLTNRVIPAPSPIPPNYTC